MTATLGLGQLVHSKNGSFCTIITTHRYIPFLLLLYGWFVFLSALSSSVLVVIEKTSRFYCKTQHFIKIVAFSVKPCIAKIIFIVWLYGL